MIINKLKGEMLNGKTAYGVFINSGSTIPVEIAGLAGFDFVMIDSEHGPTAVLDNRDLITAAEYRNIIPIVRVSNSSSDLILRTLDVGAHGIMVPQVNSLEKAKSIVEAARYCPEGNRGVATTRAADYGFISPMSEYFKWANERNLIIVQCENILALPHLDEICSLEGIDIIFLGPYDLSSSMKQLGKVDYDSIKEIVEQVLEKTKKNGKIAGIFTKNVQEAIFYSRLGFRFIIVSTDISCIATAYRNIIKTLKG